jgi:F-type H+-transporting ATPase subunit b
MLTFPPDISFVIQIASFLILWIGLKRLLFDPFLQVLETRESHTQGAVREAAAMKSDAEQSATEYERRMREVRHSLAAEAETAHQATQNEERRVLSEARDHASTQLMQLRDNLGRQAEAARPTLTSEARDLATQMFERVVGRDPA